MIYLMSEAVFWLNFVVTLIVVISFPVNRRFSAFAFGFSTGSEIGVHLFVGVAFAVLAGVFDFKKQLVGRWIIYLVVRVILFVLMFAFTMFFRLFEGIDWHRR